MTRRIATIFAAIALMGLSACGPRFVKELDPANYVPRSSAYRTAVHADTVTHSFPVVTYKDVFADDVNLSHDGNHTRWEVTDRVTSANLTVYFDPGDPQLDAGLTFSDGTTFPDGRPVRSVQVTGVSTDIFQEDPRQMRRFFGSVPQRFWPRLAEWHWYEASMMAIDERDNGVIEARGGWDHAQARISWDGEPYEIDRMAYGTFNYSPDKGYGQARVRAASPHDGERSTGREGTCGDFRVCMDVVDFYVGGRSP